MVYDKREYNSRPEVKQRKNKNRRARYEKDLQYREKQKLKSRLYRIKYPERKHIQDKIYRNDNKVKQKIYMSNYYKSNPEKFLEYSKMHYKKFGSILNMSWHDYKWALQSWSNSVRKRDSFKCVICGSADNLHSHHLIYKENYLELSLNINNGITLYVKHHWETHGRVLI